VLLLAGAGLGVFAWLADRLRADEPIATAIAGAGNAPSPWLIVAFLTGVLLVRPLWSAFVAALVLCLGVATYYFAINLSGDREGIPLQGAMTGWLTIALIAGPVFGLAGSVWRQGPPLLRPFAVGILSGALLGEVAYYMSDPLRSGGWTLETRSVLAVAEAATAFALPFLLLRPFWQRLEATLTALAMGAVALTVILTLRQLMHDLFNA